MPTVAVLPGDDAGIRRISQALAAGRPVLLPLPTPLPYVVAGTEAAAVNRAKGRPDGQTAGMLVADLAMVRPHVCLDDETFALAGRLAADERVNLFVPVRPHGPAWLAPSTADGLLGVMVACLDRFRGVLEESGHLYVSSANRTGQEVAVTAAGADAAFGGELDVLDGDALREDGVPCGSATIVRVDPGGRFDVARRGIQDAGAPSAKDYLSTAVTRIGTPPAG